MSAWSTHLPLEGVPFRDLMSERLGLPGARGQRRQRGAARRAPARGRARGATTRRWSRSAPGSAAASLLDGRIYRGAQRASAASSGTWWWTYDGRDARAPARAAAASRCWRSGTAIGREAERRPREQTRTPRSGRRLAAGAEITGALVTELAHDGDQAARAVLAEIGGAGSGPAW